MTAHWSRFDLNRLSLRTILPAGVAIGALTMGLLLSWGLYQRESAAVSSQMERYGTTLASQIAALGAEPLMAGDRVALNRIVTRLASADEVVTVGVYTLDNRALASIDKNATISPSIHSTAITFDETIAGYVRVGLDRAAFERAHENFLLWAGVICLLGTLAAVSIAIALNRLILPPLLKLHRNAAMAAHQHGPGFDPDVSPTLGELEVLADAIAPAEAMESMEGESRYPLYALVLNIFNQVSLPSDERRHVLKLCRERAQKVCRLYNGRVLTMPGTGVLCLFDGFSDDDHAFQAIFAALLIRDLVSDLNHRRLEQDRAELLLRLALDPLRRRRFAKLDEQSILDLLREELQHTVLLSATARNNTLAISPALYDAILDPLRLELSEQRSAALQSLAGAGLPHCYLVSGVAESYGALLDRQAELLLYES